MDPAASGVGRLPVEPRSTLARIFISPAEKRLRAGWRLAAQIVLQVPLLILAAISVYGIAALVLGKNALAASDEGNFLLGQLVNLLGGTASILLARRFLDRRSFKSLGLQIDRTTWLDFGAGIMITLAMMGAIFLLEWSLGWLRLDGYVWQVEPARDVIRGVLLYVAICLLVAWSEELMSRGYHLQTIASGTNLFWGWLLSSSVFGLLHAANPGSSPIAVVGLVLAGLFLGFSYLRTGRLWLAMGLHMGWNFFEGVVFGFPVSGLRFYSLPRITGTGPELWTGGSFGPEAGLVLLPALAIGAILVGLYTRNRSGATIE